MGNPLLHRSFRGAASEGARASSLLLLLENHQDAFPGIEFGWKSRAIILPPEGLQRVSLQLIDAVEYQAAQSQVDLLGLLLWVDCIIPFASFFPSSGLEGHAVVRNDQAPVLCLRQLLAVSLAG